MRMSPKWILVLAALAMGIAPARATAKEGFVPEEGAIDLVLLRQESVQQELRLNAAETQKIHDFVSVQWKKAQAINDLSPDQRNPKFQELERENQRFLDQTLQPAQRKRLRQIALQAAGLLCVTRPDVATELNLTEEQKQKARQLQQLARKEIQELLDSPSREGRKEKLQELRMTSRNRLMELLTDQQEVKWKEMTGPRFEGRFKFDAE